MKNTNDVTSEYRKEFGDKLPSLMSDVISKKIFNPDENPKRLEFLVSSIAGEDVKIKTAAKQEGFREANASKNVIFDVVSWLYDGRIADLEFQITPQDYLMTRSELYSSNMLMVQYSVNNGEKKGSIDYSKVKGIILIVLLAKTPKSFETICGHTPNYIHRFNTLVSDTGIEYSPIRKEIIVQLDKCIEQFRNGENAEAKDNLPDELQLWLSMIADVNDSTVVSKISDNQELSDIKDEVYRMSLDKEVQAMLLQEKFAISDWLSMQSEAKEKGRFEGKLEGKLEEIINSVHEGDYSIERGAQKAELSVEELRKKALLLGIQI